jgi:uncharacterized protein
MAATTGTGVLTGLYTWQYEPHWVEFVERPLPVTDLPQSLRGATVVHLSDLHIGLQVDDSYLLRTFLRINDLKPAIVVYTGDFVSYHQNIAEHVTRIFRYLPLGSLATLGVLGNHDYGPGWAHPEVADQITEIAASAGVRILRNEVADVTGLQIAGLDDYWAGRFDAEHAFAAIDASRVSIALSHNPDTADESGWAAFAGWILSGHTHGGQCRPPFLPPPLLPVRNRRYTAGEFNLSEGRKMYISRGVGHTMQVRFNARPEVTLFRLADA